MSVGRRVFIGVMAQNATRDAIATCRDAWVWPAQARLVSLADVHLTLHFLGMVSVVNESVLRTELASVRFTPARLQLDRPEVWPSGVAVLRPRDDQTLGRLHADVASVLSRLGLPVETRPWKPHVTLARDARGARVPSAPFSIAWDVHAFSLVWSRGGTGASKYEVLSSWPARPPAGSSMPP